MPNSQPIMQDQELLNDILTTQKLITANYNTFANECSSKKLRDETVCLLHEEHDIGADIFNEMHNRGWYPTPAAEQQKISDAKTKFQNIKL